MSSIIEKFVLAGLQNTENFGGGRGSMPSSTGEALASLISLVIVYLILLLVGKFLWNEYLVKYVTIVKPIPGIVELLAFSVLVRLFLC
jgi:hypothetical protein